jgi:predicted MFS family arabinose efflux permease
MADGVWAERAFVRLAAARTVSVLGSAFARVALAFAVLALPGATPGRLSLVLACQALPQVAFILIGGVIADRMSRSRLMAVSDLVGAAAYGGLAAMTLTGWAPLPAMCLLAALAGTGFALFFPAMTGVVPDVVGPDRLQQANSWLRVGTNSATLLGLSLAGVTVAYFGAGWALALDAVSFLVSALLLNGITPGARSGRRSSGLAELREGWQEFASRQWLWVIVAQYSMVSAAVYANVGVLGPLVAQRYLGGPRAWSLVVAAQALGTIAGAGLSTRMRVRRPMLVATLATFPLALPMALLAVHAGVWIVAAATFCTGVAGDVFAVLWSTTLQREVPQRALSRVSAYDAFGSLTLAPLGVLVAGPIAATAGTGPALAGCSVLVVVSTAAALASRDVRTLGSPALRPVATAAAPVTVAPVGDPGACDDPA